MCSKYFIQLRYNCSCFGGSHYFHLWNSYISVDHDKQVFSGSKARRNRDELFPKVLWAFWSWLTAWVVAVRPLLDMANISLTSVLFTSLSILGNQIFSDSSALVYVSSKWDSCAISIALCCNDCGFTMRGPRRMMPLDVTVSSSLIAL